MERQRTIPRPAGGTDGGPDGGSDGVELIRASLEGILAEADRILDGIRPVDAEDYLQQNRQRGGQ